MNGNSDILLLFGQNDRISERAPSAPAAGRREERPEQMAFKKVSAENAETATDVVIAEDAANAPVIATEITDEILRSIGSSGNAFADAVKAAAQIYGGVQEIHEELGTGFQLLTDKSTLIDRRLLLLKWNFTNGTYGTFVSVAVVTEDGGKYIVNDGSTGICEQLRQLSLNNDKYGGYIANRGLRTSTYTTCKGCGKPRPQFTEICEHTLPNNTTCGNADTARETGETYYIDLSA